ncbi:YhfG family protein [Photobacterium aquae]|uniref:YhfG family protein n=1 Tax=Photobacterium aquae TaxID=1195763 RepID=UPI0009FCF97B|nr:YhfG family protein [Photobacterium aquae]
MLTEQQKQARFKQLQARNYRASLKLEGIEIMAEQATVKGDTEAEQIANLKKQYER